VAGDSPGTRIQVIAFSEFDLLGSTAELCEAVSTAKRPAPSAGLFPVFQNPDVITRVAQLKRRCHTRYACPKNEYALLRAAFECEAALPCGFLCIAHCRHGTVHRSGASYCSNHGQQGAPRHTFVIEHDTFLSKLFYRA